MAKLPYCMECELLGIQLPVDCETKPRFPSTAMGGRFSISWVDKSVLPPGWMGTEHLTHLQLSALPHAAV